MRILMVSNFFPPSGSGSGIFCKELSKRLVGKGFEVTVLTSKTSSEVPKCEVSNGFQIKRLKSFGVGWGISALCTPIPFLLRNDSNYDVVHLHGYLFLISNQTALVKRLKGFPFIIHLHGGMEIPGSAYVGKVKPFVKEYLYDPIVGRFTLNSADVVLSVSKKDIEISESKFGVRPQWVPNGVDTDVFRPQKKEKGKISFVGKLEKWKGAERLPFIVKKILEHHDIELHIVGEGSLLKKIKRECEGLPVVFHGGVPHADIPTIIATSELLLLPSLMEGLPLACLESLACETPVIATDVGGMSEIIIEGKTGVLVPPHNMDQFTQKIDEMLDDDEMRGRLGKNGRNLVKKYYDWDRIVDRCTGIYKTVGELHG